MNGTALETCRPGAEIGAGSEMPSGSGIRSLHVIYSAANQLGGSVHAALNVCHHLTKAGHVATVLATNNPSDDVAYLKTDHPHLACHLVPQSFPGRFYNSNALIERLPGLLRETSSELVEIHGVWTPTTVRVARACRELGVPYLIRPHGSLDPVDFQKHAVLKRWLWKSYFSRAFAEATAVMFATEHEAERAVTPGTKIRREVVPLPIIEGPRGDRARGRAKFGISDDAIVVLFLSRVDAGKGLDLLIPIMGRLAGDFPSLRLLLAGSGDAASMREVDKSLDATGVRARAVLPGFLKGVEKADAFAAADLLVLLSERENFGLAVVEAMQVGLPVVVSSEVPLSPDIRRLEAGLVCDRTMDAGAAALRRLIADASLRARLGANARTLCREVYSPEAATRRLVDLYRRIPGRRRP